MIGIVRAIGSVRAIRTIDHRPTIVIEANITGIGNREFRDAIEPCGRETDHRVDAPGHLGQQHEAMTTAHRPGRASAAGAGRRGLGLLARVGACGNRFLQAFDITQISFAGRYRLRALHMPRLVGQQLRPQFQAAVAPKGQLGTIIQVHGHSPCGAGLELFSGKQPVPFDQHPTGAVLTDREDLTDNLADHTE